MTVYPEKEGLSLLTGASDADADPISVRRINGEVPVTWPVTVVLTVGSVLVYESGVVEYEDGGDLSEHPDIGSTLANGSFTFALWDGEEESDEQTATVVLHGSGLAPFVLCLSRNLICDTLPSGSVLAEIVSRGTAPMIYELVSSDGLPVTVFGQELRTTGTLVAGDYRPVLRATGNTAPALELPVPVAVKAWGDVVSKGQSDPSLAPGPNGEASFFSVHGTELSPRGSGIYRYVDAAVSASGGGLSPGSALKTIQEAVDAAQRGDTILVRGGVYREAVTFADRLTTAGDRVTIARYGSETVVVSGADPLTGWVACSSQTDARSNPNWAQMFRVTVPSGHPFGALAFNLCQSGRMMHLNVLGDDSFFGTNTENMLFRNSVPSYLMAQSFDNVIDGGGASYNTFVLTDPGRLSGYTVDDFKDIVIGWHYGAGGNNVSLGHAQTFDPATGTISTSQFQGSSRLATGAYVIMNDVARINAPGQWGWRKNADGSHDLWCWPWDATKMDELEISSRRYGFNLANSTGTGFYGIDIVQQSGDNLFQGLGIGQGSHNGSLHDDSLIEECSARRFTLTVSDIGPAGLSLALSKRSTMRNNTVEEMQDGIGMFVVTPALNAGGAVETLGAFVTENIIRRTGSTGMKVYGAENSVVAFNEIREVFGAHGNGMSNYLGCYNLIVFGNIIRTGSGIGLTHQDGTNIWYLMNDIQSPAGEAQGRGLENNSRRSFGDYPAADPRAGVIVVSNNTVGPSDGQQVPGGGNAIIVGKTGNTTHHTINNVAFGSCDANLGTGGTDTIIGTQSGNVLCGLAQGQTFRDLFFAGGLNSYFSAPSALFVDWRNDNYLPLPSGPLEQLGVDWSSNLPSGPWLDALGFDLNRDCLGRSFDPVTEMPTGAYLPA